MILLTTIFILLSTLALENNSKDKHYQVIKVIGEIEIRQYNKLLYVSYIPKNEVDRSNSFRKVANFIFGNNSKNENISMTSPVVMKTYNKYEMAFIMPSNYSIDNLPKANSDELNIYEEPGLVKACITYSGFSNAVKEQKYIKKLQLILNENSIEHKSDFEVLIYNAPYQLLNRKNEITVSVLL